MTRQLIVGKKWDIYTGNIGCAISIVGGNFEARIADGAEQAVVYKTAVAETWQHVALVRNGNDFVLYNNGGSGITVTKTVGDISHDFNFRIGRTASGNYPLNAIVDEVRAYNRALSAAEVQENFQEGPDFSSMLLAKVPKGTTQIISIVSWQGTGSMNITVESPSESYTEDTVPVYQKASYSTSDGIMSMLNVKRLSISVSALSSDEN
jgi:hypothetical protein